MHGPITNEKVETFKDLNKREIAYLVPIVIMMFWMGIFPNMFLRKMDSSVSHLLTMVNTKKATVSQTLKNPDVLVKIDDQTPEEQNKDKEEQTR